MRKFALALLLALPLSAQAGTTKLDPVTMQPQDETYAIYSGQGSAIGLKIANEDPGHDVDAFPDPSLRVIQLASSASCTTDGGIWVRQHIYLVMNERLLITHQYSGSNDELVVSRTDGCAEVARFPVTGQSWRVTTDGIELGSECQDESLAKCRKTMLARFATLLNDRK